MLYLLFGGLWILGLWIFNNRVKIYIREVLKETSLGKFTEKIWGKTGNIWESNAKLWALSIMLVSSLLFFNTGFNEWKNGIEKVNYQNILVLKPIDINKSYYTFMDGALFAIEKSGLEPFMDGNNIKDIKGLSEKISKGNIKIYPTTQEEIKTIKGEIIFLNGFANQVRSLYDIGIGATYFNIQGAGDINYLNMINNLVSIAMGGILIYFIWISFKKMGGLTGDVTKNGLATKEDLKSIVDFGGNKHLTKTIEELIKLNSVKNGIDTVKGILLYGPPGTGKTLFGKHLAKQLNMPFYYLSAGAFRNKYYGGTGENVRNLFQKIRKELKTDRLSNAIIFLDELDSIGSKRSNSHEATGEGLNQLLTEIDGFKSEDGIIIIGATNRLETLDDALLSRFNLKNYVGLPNKDERVEIIRNQLQFFYDNQTDEGKISLDGWFEVEKV